MNIGQFNVITNGALVLLTYHFMLELLQFLDRSTANSFQLKISFSWLSADEYMTSIQMKLTHER